MIDEFYYLINGHQIKKFTEMEYESLIQKSGLRQIELEILYYLGSASVLRVAKEIVDNWNLSKSHVSKSLEHLREEGYIVSSEDSNDHRCAHLEITPEGRELIKEIGRRKAEVHEILYQGVTKEEREVIARVAGKMRENISLEMKR